MNFGLSRKEALQRARDLMAVVHLPPAAIDRFPHQFSGGQRQRICIARALAMEPELLIGDEPVSALDVSVQDQVLKLLDEVRRKFNLAVLFITHDLRVAAQVCDRIAVMQRGVIVEQGPRRRFLPRPSTNTPGHCSTPRPAGIRNLPPALDGIALISPPSLRAKRSNPSAREATSRWIASLRSQ